MKGNRGTDTKPEVLVRSALHRAGLRFRKNRRLRLAKGSVRADVVFPIDRIAIFIDGCYWHRCPDHGTDPQTNRKYWRAKLDGNVRRDAVVTAALRADGWTVLRIWEHVPPDEAVSHIGA